MATTVEVVIGAASVVSAVGVLLVLLRIYRPSMRKWRDGIKRWARGRYIPPPAPRPFDRFVVISPGRYQCPWIIERAIRAKRFVRRNWTEILVTVSTIATVMGTAAAVIPLFR